MKKIISIILAISIFMCLTVNVSAHTQVQNTVLDEYTDKNGNKYYVGAESIGWIIDEYGHIGKTSITYRFDSNVPSKYKTMFRNAASSWETYTQATLTEVSANANVVVKYALLALTSRAESSTHTNGTRNYHSSNWTITINNINIAVEHDLIHEIGHVFGLHELRYTDNQNKIMFINGSSRTATHPTSSDIKGFKVITGLHSTHSSWKYSNTAKYCATCGGIKTFNEPHNFKWTPYSSATHKGYCSTSGLTVYENHSYYLSGSKCTRCGSTNTGGSTVNIPDEELVE